MRQKKINKRHAKRWAYSAASRALTAAMAEGWPHFEGFLPETADKLETALREVRDSLAVHGLMETDPVIWREKP